MHRIYAGVGARVQPEFPGADSSEVRVLPALDVAYGRWFFNRDGLGGYLFNDSRWQIAASVAPDFDHRDEASTTASARNGPTASTRAHSLA